MAIVKYSAIRRIIKHYYSLLKLYDFSSEMADLVPVNSEIIAHCIALFLISATDLSRLDEKFKQIFKPISQPSTTLLSIILAYILLT